MADEGLREIQLDGKQLVFLFMTAAVVLVVTFLFGVLVGRGVRGPKEPTVAADMLAPGTAPTSDPTAGGAAPPPAAANTPPAQQPTTPPPTPPEEELSYYSRLESQPAPADTAKPASAPAGKDQKTQQASADAKAATAKGQPAVAPAPAVNEPAAPGYALKVGAYKGRPQADALAQRLASKGYSTYVVQLPSTTRGPGLFSVQVGKFKTQKEADAARRRLEKEEKLKPLLTSR